VALHACLVLCCVVWSFEVYCRQFPPGRQMCMLHPGTRAHHTGCCVSVGALSRPGPHLLWQGVESQACHEPVAGARAGPAGAPRPLLCGRLAGPYYACILPAGCSIPVDLHTVGGPRTRIGVLGMVQWCQKHLRLLGCQACKAPTCTCGQPVGPLCHLQKQEQAQCHFNSHLT
jgi:hypothetical protein